MKTESVGLQPWRIMLQKATLHNKIAHNFSGSCFNGDVAVVLLLRLIKLPDGFGFESMRGKPLLGAWA